MPFYTSLSACARIYVCVVLNNSETSKTIKLTGNIMSFVSHIVSL